MQGGLIVPDGLHENLGIAVVVEVSRGQEAVCIRIVFEDWQKIPVAVEPALAVVEESGELAAEEEEVEISVPVQIHEHPLPGPGPGGGEVQAGIPGSLANAPAAIVEKNDQMPFSGEDGIEVSIAIQVSPEGAQVPYVTAPVPQAQPLEAAAPPIEIDPTG